MSYRSGLVTGIATTTLFAAAVACAYWLMFGRTAESAKSGAPPAPASVAKPLQEDQLNTVTLTPEAVARLALQTSRIERQPLRPTRLYGGDVTIPAGRSIMVAAPVSGVVKAAAGTFPTPGQTVQKGQALLQLLPLLTPEGRANLTSAKIDAAGQVKGAETRLEAAKIALNRAQRMLVSEAGSRRTVDEAEAQFALEQQALAAATSRRDLLQRLVGEAEAGTAGPLTIDCPEDGLIRNVMALPDQSVPAGAALCEVVDLSHVWVRVPVYVGDVRDVDATAAAAVGNVTAKAGGATVQAQPATAPPSANPATGTVDLFYELDNRTAQFSPGERVGVTLQLKAEADSLTAPWAAVIHDIYGGTWVYEQTAERTYARRRVLVRCVTGKWAVLAAGPAPGTTVVTDGAAELFGTETGFTK